ncbi:unnamed protein product [Urochloa humidicola]
MDVDDGPATAKPAANGGESHSSGARPVDVVDGAGGEEGDTLPGVVRGFVDGVWCPGAGGDEPLLRRLKAASRDAAPRLRGASRNSARDLLEWTRRGSGLRAILVISELMKLFGEFITLSSPFPDVAAAGGFLAIFFACVVAVYIGAVSVAVFAISATVISAVVGVMIATGWVGFFWMVWFAARKSMDLTKHSIGATTSVIQSYSASRHANQKPVG